MDPHPHWPTTRTLFGGICIALMLAGCGQVGTDAALNRAALTNFPGANMWPSADFGGSHMTGSPSATALAADLKSGQGYLQSAPQQPWADHTLGYEGAVSGPTTSVTTYLAAEAVSGATGTAQVVLYNGDTLVQYGSEHALSASLVSIGETFSGLDLASPRDLRTRIVLHVTNGKGALRVTQAALAVTAGGGSASGVPMPQGNLPGWKQVFADDFSGTSVDASKWGMYSGEPGWPKGGRWDPTHAVVSGGLLTLETYKSDGGVWTSAGMSSAKALQQTYGKYEVRFRAQAGDGVTFAWLLWPVKGWPPEIDFAEDDDGTRLKNAATLHYGASNSQVHRSVTMDLTQWHTLGVEWTKDALSYTLDGAVYATVTGSDVPSQPMVLDLQAAANPCGSSTAGTSCAGSTTPPLVKIDVDWLVAYAPD